MIEKEGRKENSTDIYRRNEVKRAEKNYCLQDIEYQN